MEVVYANRRTTPPQANRLTVLAAPKRQTTKPPKPSPRPSGIIDPGFKDNNTRNISPEEEEDIVKAIKLSLQEFLPSTTEVRKEFKSTSNLRDKKFDSASL